MRLTAILLLSLLLLGCSAQSPVIQEEVLQEQQAQVNMTQIEEVTDVAVEGKKVVMIIAPEGFRDEEYLHPKEVLEDAGIEVITASKGNVAEAKGKISATVKVDKDITELNADDYDAIIFVGGPGATVFFNDTTAHRLANDAYDAGKIVAAICIAPATLANAGILKDHKATSFPSEKETVEAASKEYTAEPVTVDGKVVTGNGPEAAKDFGKAIVKLLEE